MPIFHTTHSFKSYRFLCLSLDRMALTFPDYIGAFPVDESRSIQQAISESFYLHAALALYIPDNFDRFFDPITLQRTPALSFRLPQSYPFEVITRLKTLIKASSVSFISPERTPTESFYQILDLAIARIETSQIISLQDKGDALCLYELDIMSEVKDITGFCDEHIELLFYAPTSQNALLWWQSSPRPDLDTRLQPLSPALAHLLQSTEKTIFELTEAYWEFLNQKDLEAFRRIVHSQFTDELSRQDEKKISLLDLVFFEAMGQRSLIGDSSDASTALTSAVLSHLEGLPMIESLSFSLSEQTSYIKEPLFYQEAIAGNSELFGSLKDRIQSLYSEALKQARATLASASPKEICSFIPYDLLIASSDSSFSQWVARRFPSALEEIEEHRALSRMNIHSTMSFRSVPTNEDIAIDELIDGTIQDTVSDQSDYSHAAHINRAEFEPVTGAHWEAIGMFFAQNPWSFYPLSDCIAIFHHLLGPDLLIELMKSNRFFTVTQIIGNPEHFFIPHVAHHSEIASWINPPALAHYACALQNPSMAHLILEQARTPEDLHNLCLQPLAIESEIHPQSLLERALGLSQKGGALALYMLKALSEIAIPEQRDSLEKKLTELSRLKTSCGSTIAILLIDTMHHQCQLWMIERLNRMEVNSANEALRSLPDNRRSLLSAIIEQELEGALSPEIRSTICDLVPLNDEHCISRSAAYCRKGARP